MLRTVIIDATRELLRALETSGVEQLEAFRRGGPSADEMRRRALYSLHSLLMSAGEWGALENRIINELGVRHLVEPETLFKANDPGYSKFISSEGGRAIAAIRLIHDLVSEGRDSGSSDQMATAAAQAGYLRIVIRDLDGSPSNPQRVADALMCIQWLYEICQRLHRDSTETIYLQSCDSGSDKAFDFLGAAATMSAVKELVVSIWDRAYRSSERRVREQMEALATTLPIIQKIHELKEQGSLGPEEAQMLKSRVIRAAEMLLESDLVIPELGPRSPMEIRGLTGANLNLLPGPSADPLQQAGAIGVAPTTPE